MNATDNPMKTRVKLIAKIFIMSLDVLLRWMMNVIVIASI